MWLTLWQMVTFILLHIFHVIIRLLISNTVVVHLLYTASEITSIYTEILVQYHSKATDTAGSIKLKREEFLYIRAIFNFQTECVLIYMLLLYQISAWVFLMHTFLYAGFYCTTMTKGGGKDTRWWIITTKSKISRTIVSRNLYQSSVCRTWIF